MNLISNKFTHLNQAHYDHLSGSLRQPIIILGIQTGLSEGFSMSPSLWCRQIIQETL